MRGKHRKSAQLRDANRLTALQAEYATRFAEYVSLYQKQESDLQLEIDRLTLDRDRMVNRLASEAITKAQQEAEALESSTRESWDLFCAALVDAMFSIEDGDEPWNPSPGQLQRFASALGIPPEIVLAMREQVLGLDME